VKNLFIKPQLIKIGQAAGLAVVVVVFAIAALAAVFLFASHANAQDFSQYGMPREVCKAYRSAQGYSIVRDTTNDCLVRSGSNDNVGFAYVHAYNTGNNFCVEMTSSKMGQVIPPQCAPITQANRAAQQQGQQQNTSKKIVTPPSFQIKELQYDTLPHGKPIKTGDNERIELEMPDGSLIQIDANATFTPVSDHEVQSVFGRYRYMWQPFHDGKCIVGQNLVRQECRKVKTSDAILGDKGTEFLVDSDKKGTTVTVLDGIVIATDLGGKKTVEVAAGQSTFIKKGGLPEDPKSYDPDKIDHWWEKKTSKQSSQDFLGVMFVATIFVVSFLILVAIIKKIFQKKKPVPAIAPAVEEKIQTVPVVENSSDKEKKKNYCLGCLIAIIIILFSSLIFIFSSR